MSRVVRVPVCFVVYLNATQRDESPRDRRLSHPHRTPDPVRLPGYFNHVLLNSTNFNRPLEAAVDEPRELGRELGRRFIHEDIPAGQQGGVDL